PPAVHSWIHGCRSKTVSLGTAIFLSALILGAVALYGLTMDRWDWGRLGKAFADFGRMLLILGALILLIKSISRVVSLATPIASSNIPQTANEKAAPGPNANRPRTT